jgi:hypothetical protein
MDKKINAILIGMKNLLLIFSIILISGCVTDTPTERFQREQRNRRVQEIGEAFERGDITLLQRQKLMNDAFRTRYPNSFKLKIRIKKLMQY